LLHGIRYRAEVPDWCAKSLRRWHASHDGRNPRITVDVTTARRYHIRVIWSWADDEAEKLVNRQRSRKLPPDLQRVALRKLLMLDAATTLEDLRVPPANRLEKLKGDREGQWSIRINDQWRVCFAWRDGNAHDVEIVDYH
jgi:proteic killer suppression protein